MRIIPIILLLAIAVSPAGAVDFRQRFDEAVRTADDTQVDRSIADWTAAEPQNPEIYVTAANYYFKKACRDLIQATTKPPEKGAFSIVDPKSGKVVGSLGPAGPDPVAASRAANLLQEATRKFPERLDIWFGLAYIHKELQNFDALYATLEEALKYCAGNSAGLKWKNGQPLPKDPATFMPEHAQAHIKDYSSRGTPADDERAFRLAKLVAESYPNHPYPMNFIGVYYARKEEWAQAVSYLEKAHQIDPGDAIIMVNLGMIHAQMHENAKARAYFEKVIASNADENIRQRARKGLAELK